MVSVMLLLVHVGVVQAAWERVGCITEKPAFVQDLYVVVVVFSGLQHWVKCFCLFSGKFCEI